MNDLEPRLQHLPTCMLLTLLLAAAAGAQSPDPSADAAAEDVPAAEAPRREPTVVQAHLHGPPGNRHVRSVRPLRPHGGRVDWSRQGDWIAFDQAGGNGAHDIQLMNVKTEAERCLTCDRWELRKLHCLSPTWHPSGEYVVFTVQDRPRRARLESLALATADRGLHADVWMITSDGHDAWQLTRIAADGGAVLDPYFSYEADRLVWSERMETGRGRWGYWSPRVAELSIKHGLPRLGKVRTHDPPLPKGLIVAHGFTPDDRGLMISAGDFGSDILRFDLESRSVERLTSASDTHDSAAFVAPRSDRIVWVSDRNVEPPGRGVLPFRGDLWFLSERERLQERLTFFNDPESDHYLGETLIDDLAWSPDGDRLAVHVVYVEPEAGGEPLAVPVEDEDGPRVSEAIYLVELDKSFLR
jgi:Tol biopolymer transport system component